MVAVELYALSTAPQDSPLALIVTLASRTKQRGISSTPLPRVPGITPGI
jgi:hypothetical protein